MYLIAVVAVLGFQYRRLQELKKRQEEAVRSNIIYDLEIADFQVNSMNGRIRDLFMGMLTRDDIFKTEDQDYAASRLETIRSNNTVASVLYSSIGKGNILSSSNAWFQTGDSQRIRETIEEAKKTPNVTQYSSPYYSYMIAGYSVCAAMASSTGDRVVAAEVNLSQLYSNLHPLLRGKGRSFFLTDRADIPILFDRNNDELLLVEGMYPLQLKPEIKEILETGKKEGRVQKPLSGKQGYRYLISAGNDLSWKIVAIYRPDILMEGLNGGIQEIYFFTLAFMLFLGIVLLTAAFGITRPLRSLAETMAGVRNIEDLTIIENTRQDEIGLLQESYNKLILRIHELMWELQETETKKKTYEIRMLQDQIGPHFLHNTLTCLSILIRQGKGDKAEEGIRSLLGLLTYSFESTGEMTTIEKELDILSDYIYIEKLRYGNIFSYEARADQSILDKKIPKMTIQPILENAVFHGVLSRDTDDGHIIVDIQERNGMLVIRVCDNGSGIHGDRKKHILKGGASRKEGRSSRIGVKNVNERIKLLYGDKYGISIQSSKKGTIVQICLPVRK